MSDHGHGNGHSDSHGDGHGHGGVSKYLSVFLALCVLTAISFWLGNSDLKRNSQTVAWIGMFAVSCAKASLVMLFFMHLIWEANWKYVLTIPASIMSVFMIAMLVPDIGKRDESYSEERRVNVTASDEYVRDAHGVTHKESKPEHGEP